MKQAIAIRARILKHGKTKQTPEGPQYVGCACKTCEALRKELADIRMKALTGA